jgi:hypothetical protein
VEEMATNRRSDVSIDNTANRVIDKPSQPGRWIGRVRNGRYHQARGGDLKLIEDQNNSDIIGYEESANS